MYNYEKGITPKEALHINKRDSVHSSVAEISEELCFTYKGWKIFTTDSLSKSQNGAMTML